MDTESTRGVCRVKMSGLCILVMLLVQGCAVVNVATAGFSTLPDRANLMLMPPDIKYFRVTASGITEPNADWTAEARQSFQNAFQNFVAENSLKVSEVANDGLSDVAVEYDRLHSAVGSTILANHFGATKLPAKDGAFDWSLGNGVNGLLTLSEERYALFVHYRDYQASGGRVGMAVFASLLGASIYTGHQTGFASLVDLQSGNVLWFNYIPLAQGDMRSPNGANKLVQQLFSSLVEDEG